MAYDPEYKPPEKAVEMLVPKHEENFDVICLKDGVELWAAKVEDLKRISVRASGSLDARHHEKVQREGAGYSIIEIIGGNATSEIETAARRRAAAASEQVHRVDPVVR